MKKAQTKGKRFINNYVLSRFCGSFFVKIFPFIFIFLLISMSSHALLQWSPTNGPWGGHIELLEVGEDGTIYAGIWGGGIFKSTNGGLSWEWASTGITKYSNKIEALRAGRNGYVFTSPSGMGVYRSTDSGENWRSKNNNIGDYSINDIAVDPVDKNNIYIATVSTGIYKSTNEAESWFATGLGSEVSPVTCIAIATSETGKVIYAGTNAKGVWKSTDEAVSWIRISSGEAALDSQLITSIAAAPSSAETVYVGRYIGGSNPKVYKSTDGGNSWVSVFSPEINLNTVNKIDVDPVSAEVVYISTSYGFFKSSNGTTAQELTDIGEIYSKDIAVDPADSSIVYAGNYGSGVFKSTNYGMSFEASNSGINNILIRALEIASVEGNSTLYAAPYAEGGERLGLFKSSDEGYSWDYVESFDPTWEIRAIYVAPASPEVVYVGVLGGPPCLFRSTDSGGTWVAIDVSSKARLIDITSDPHSANILYLATWGSANSNVFRSTDFGQSWQAWATGLPGDNPYCIHAAYGTMETIVFLGTDQYAGSLAIWRRKTSSGNWARVAYNMTGLAYSWVFDIADVPTREMVYIMYDAGGQTLKKSIYDEDVTWEAVGNASGTTGDLETDNENPYKYYVVGRYKGSEHHIYSFDENRSPLKIEENYELPSLNVDFSGNCWLIELDVNSSKNARVLYSGLPARSVWKAETISETLPIPPSGFSGSAEATDSIRWSWQDNSLTELGYRLYSYPDLSLISEKPPGSTSDLETGLLTNRPYTREVSAYNSAGESFSNVDQTYTLANKPGTPAGAAGNVWVSLSWSPNGNPVWTKYQVHRSTSEAGTGFPIGWRFVVTTETTSYFDFGLTTEAKYWYKIYAINGDGILSEPSEAKDFITLPVSPSADVLPPKIENVRFDGRLYFAGIYGQGDIIYERPRISARIEDTASGEVGEPNYVTPEGIDITSVKIHFGNVWHFPIEWYELSTSETELIPPSTTPPWPKVVYLDYTLPWALGSGTYVATIEAKDVAYPWYNRGVWTGKVIIFGPKVEMIGPTIAYPTPYKPLSQVDLTISYSLSTNSNVSVFIYDISGQVVLRRNYMAGSEGGKAGYNAINWNGISDIGGGYVGNGIYVYKIVSEGKAIGTGKIVVFD